MAHQLGSVLVRLAAVILFIQSIQALAYVNFFIDQSGESVGLLGNLLGFSVLIPGAFAALLWRFPDTVARLQPVADSSADSGKADARQFLLAGVSLLGLYAIVFGIVDGVRVESSIYVQKEMNEMIGNSIAVFNYQTLSGRLAYGAQVVLGFVLMFGRKTIARMLWKAKYGGAGAT